MNSFQIVEIFVILIIISFQVYIFIRTNSKIQTYKNVFPEATFYEVYNLNIKPHFYSLHPNEILNNIKKFEDESNLKIVPTPIKDNLGIIINPVLQEKDTRVTTQIILQKSKGNSIANKIFHTINIYLLRNRSIASDFNLIKDIVERNAEVLENEINQTISLPLYLGLLGTFIGIVMGLIQISGMNFQTNSDSFDIAISTLLNGVMIAMVASFAGLLLTIINSGYYFKNAKSSLEESKNDFYTFIQIELLPLLNQGVNSTLYSLQNNLHKFNEEFNSNLTKLNSVMGKNHEALISQERILNSLENLDITEFAKANVKILKQLQFSTESFQEFNNYLGAMNSFVSQTTGLTTKMNEMIARTDNFNLLGQHILSTFQQNQKLIEFLQSHYNSLDESHQLITNSVGKVNNTLDESLDMLKTFTQEKIIEVQKLVSKELDLLETQYPEKWKKLDNLSHLKQLDENLSKLKVSNESQISLLTTELKKLNSTMEMTLEDIGIIKANSKNYISDKISSTLKKVFSRN